MLTGLFFTSWEPSVPDGGYLLESCFWSCRTRAAVCCCCWVCCKPCLGNCNPEKGGNSALSTDESRRSAAHFEALRRTTPSAPTLIFSQPWSTPGRNLKVPHPFQNPSPGGDLAFAGRALRKEPSRAQWFTHSCYLSLHQLASQYHHVTNHLHQQTESCLVGGLGQAPQAWPWANGDKSVVSSAGAWTHLGLLPDGG